MLSSHLASRLELWGFEEGLMVFKDRSLGAAFRLKAIDVSVATAHAANEIRAALKIFLNGLPAGMSIQFVQEVVSGNRRVIDAHENTLLSDAQPLVCEMARERACRLRALDDEGLLPKRNLYLFVRRPFARSQKVKSENFWRRKASEPLTEESLKREIESFRQVLSSIDGALGMASLERLDEEAVFRLIYNQWNPDRPAPARLSASHDVRDQAALTDCSISPDAFALGRVRHRLISLKLLPEQTFATMAEKLQHLPFDSRLHLSIDALDQNSEIASLQTQRRLAFASAVGKKGVADLESQAKLRDIEAILEEMIQGSEKAFRASLNVVLRSDDENELELQTADCLRLIRELSGAEAMVETVAGFDVFCELALPNARARTRAVRVKTSVLADFLPVYGDWPGHDVPRVLLRGRSGSLLSFDPFSSELTNSNQIVSGGSGSGKSFLCNLILAQTLKEKPKVFILDIGGSYKKLCENLGGQYVELGLASGLSINPLSRDGIAAGDEEAMDQKIKSVSSLVQIMTKESGASGIGRLERAELEGAIANLIRRPEPARLTDLQNALAASAEPEMRRLARVLSLWCGDSPYGKFVDRETTIELRSDLVCFDLKGLDSHPDLQAACLFLITDLVWRETQRDRTRMKF